MSRIKWRDQYRTVPNRSKFHKKVQTIFRTDSFFSTLRCYQEIAVSELIPEYVGTHWYDWYIEELETIIELHGEQHYRIANFGNIAAEAAEQAFNDIQERDREKKYAALEAGYEYIEIPYKYMKRLTPELLSQLVLRSD